MFDPITTFVDQIDAERAARDWLVSLIPTDRSSIFWAIERKTFAQPSEGGSTTVLRREDRVVATAICIRDSLNRTTLVRANHQTPEVMDLHGVRRDGSMSAALAKAGLSPSIKMKEIAEEFFGPLPRNEDAADSTDVGMCLAAMEQFYKWLQTQAVTLGGPEKGPS